MEPYHRFADVRWPSRRRVLAALAALGSVAIPLRSRGASAPTPAMTEGPFYPERFSASPSPSLVRGPIDRVPALRLEGRVGDSSGAPLAGARVEIWQCDALGRYHHSRDGRPEDRDPNFAGFGWVATDAQGRYAFDTIRPQPYSGRTPHIHLAVLVDGRRRLVTQVFVDGEPGNAGDFLYRLLPAEARRRLTMVATPAGRGFTGRFDVVLA